MTKYSYSTNSISTTLPKNVKIFETIEEFDKNLPETVKLLKSENGSKVYLIGTAHFSLQSQEDVSLVMRNVKPDYVVLELCPLRLHILQYDEATLLKTAAELNAKRRLEIIKENGFTNGMFYIQFLNINSNIIKQLGIAPGGECRRAFAESQILPECQVFLGDRSIFITMKRAISGLSILDKIKMSLYYMVGNRTAPITLEDVERLKKLEINEDFLKATNNNQKMSSLHKAFVWERDLILCHSLKTATKLRIDRNKSNQTLPVNVVGVVGIGHSWGIENNWNKTISNEQIQNLLTIPTKGNFLRNSINKLCKLGVIALSCYGAYSMYFTMKTYKAKNE